MPQETYKQTIDIRLVQNFNLIHYTESQEIIDPITKKLKLEHVVKRTDHLRDYSNNLLSVFKKEDIFIEIIKGPLKEQFTSLWKKGTVVPTPLFSKDFTLNEKRGYFFLNISDCHNKTVTEYQDETKVKPKCKIIHTPTNCNYWHFSLRWLHNDQDIINMTKKQRRRILTAAKAFIIENCFFTEPTVIKKLQSSVYDDLS